MYIGRPCERRKKEKDKILDRYSCRVYNIVCSDGGLNDCSQVIKSDS